jgi:hypothetical protein
VASRPPRDKAEGARARSRGLALCVGLAVCGSLLGPGTAAGQDVPPDEPWRTLETAHFRITFPAPLEALARRAGWVAESARERLNEVLVAAPAGRVELVLTDHADFSNGFAEIAPYPRVVVFARPPIDGFALSHFDDWLDLVVTHELAHIHHLDVTGIPGRVLRTVFGRVPAPWPFFPSQGAPGWVVEGLATWYESSLTGQGRVEGTYLEMILRAAALEGRLESIDQASGRSPSWPSGQRAYAYGALVFDWLLERYGAGRTQDFVAEVGSQWVPYRLNAAARSAFGVTFDEAWEAWSAERVADARRLAATVAERDPRPVIEPLTSGARLALHGQVGPDGTLAYARADGRSDSQLRFRTKAGPDSGPDSGGTSPLAWPGPEHGVRTHGAASFSWAPDGSVIASQFEVQDLSRLRRDLYRIDQRGRVRRLTRNQRLEHPALTPEGAHVWAVQTTPGRTRLVRVALADGTVEAPPGLPTGANWGFPAVSPDGAWVAAIRWDERRGPDLVVLDARDGAQRLAVTDDRALELAPAWAPDGTLLWISDRTGIPNLYAARVDPAEGGVGPYRQVTDVATGVGFPSVDPTGRWIVVSIYGAGGWDLARLPYDPARWSDPLPPAEGRAVRRDVASGAPAAGDSPSPGVTGTVRPYRPWQTLRPRFWEPLVNPSVTARGRRVLGPFFGLSTRSRDVVGRHQVDLAAAVSTTDAALDGRATYEYRGLGSPVLSLTAGQGWDAAGPLVDSLYLRERERRLGGDVTFLHNRYRRAWALGVGAGMAWENRELLESDLSPSDRFRLARPDARLGDVRLTLSTSSARAHELSVGPGAGWTAFARLRTRHELAVPDGAAGRPGQDRGFDEALGWARAYRSFSGPGFADHVLAVQVAGGSARGPGADAFHFDLGGASGQAEPVSGLSLFGGRTLLFPVRGYPDGWRSGRHAWAASVEWRMPLRLVNRGWGLVPLHLDRLHGAVFVDAGNAWGPELGLPGYDRPRRATLVGAGAELRAEVLTFFTVPLSLRLGVGAPLVEGDGPRLHVRFGSAF